MTSIPGPPDFRLEIRSEGPQTVVAAVGELDLAGAGDFAGVLRERLENGPVLLDLSELTFMDSSGVRALDTVLEEARRERRALALRREMHDHVRQVLEMTGFYDALPFAADPPA